MNLFNKVKESIKKYNLLAKGDKVIVSVSGGPDSLTLLHILWRLQSDFNLGLHVFHLDHMFRGEESKADAEYVAEFSEELGIPVTIKEYDVPGYIKKRGLSKQAAARKIRYELCTELANKVQADKIAIGQHADDQAETVLMNFLRGSGLEGLGGIEPIRDEMFIRPLLEVWRSDIEDYCQEYNFRPRIDSSNLKPIYRRNKIRLELLPYLADEFNGSIKENLNRMANILRVENSFLNEYTIEKYKKIVVSYDKDELLLDLGSLSNLELAIRRRVIRQAIGDFCGGKRDYYFHHVKQIEELITDGETGKRLQLPEGLRIERSYNALRFFWQGTNSLKSHRFVQVYSIPGQYKVEELGIKVDLEIIPKDDNWQEKLRNSNELYLDYELIGNEFKIRNRRDGDRFQPLGMKGNKKIKDFLIDEKVPRRMRDQIPILSTVSDEIFAVGKLRINDKFKITDYTERILTLDINKAEEGGSN
ncbi:tRNA lysidine(34) synthetase TilS [Selenihalanaerobacter shriftii]|uniref:tRNA(Ile)-lysidine synthase n=1 Tax=Selenihalanaerobacter shriftii TaxID=142842 RepID=A0A1T4R4S7_9FIRM|nr:tRNA lysidine(34) synthetase TilS [Selenihalanaerobacter shriftii]SKA10963.1 tRNA(Ile)-lysidine synthase [Selenihalanaerobacter shriftii]